MSETPNQRAADVKALAAALIGVARGLLTSYQGTRVSSVMIWVGASLAKASGLTLDEIASIVELGYTGRSVYRGVHPKFPWQK